MDCSTSSVFSGSALQRALLESVGVSFDYTADTGTVESPLLEEEDDA